MRPKLLYCALNNGSDTRITKEVRTYSKDYDVYFLGIGRDDCDFIDTSVVRKIMINGNYRNPISLFRYCLFFLLYRVKLNPSVLHIVDEQLWLILRMITWQKYKVRLDIFDSIFLKLNKPGNDLSRLKYFLYNGLSLVYVTDENRLKLLPDKVTTEVRILPNVPMKNQVHCKLGFSNPNRLNIFYVGTLLKDRGSSYAKLLLQSDNVHITCIGWIKDDFTEELLNHDRVRYLGVLSQNEVNKIISLEADYIIGIYPTDNINNIYASPNKVYDAIHTSTPLIINEGILVANFVSSLNIGLTVPDNYLFLNLDQHIRDLYRKRDSFEFSNELVNKYSWENYEEMLLK